MRKRAFEDSDAFSSLPTPSKRLHTLQAFTPAKSTTSSSWSTPRSVYSVPSDSPTNPFGLKRSLSVLALVLPKPTSFSKHLPLRFQLIESHPRLTRSARRPARRKARKVLNGSDEEELSYDEQGTYRIVQVPLSYTFRHLHALILFLFNGNPNPTAPPHPGHLFEVQKRIIMHGHTHKPGQIKTGNTFLRLSRLRDPYYSSRSIMDLADAPLEDFEGEGNGEWKWEGEEDVVLAHVWRKIDFTRGIVYHHDSQTTIHICCSSQPIKGRRGVGNEPFVFRAFGDVLLDPATGYRSPSPSPPPRLIFPSTPLKAPTFPTRATHKPSEGPGDTEVEDSDEEQRERKARQARNARKSQSLAASTAQAEDFDGGLNTTRWNREGAFPRFLARMSPSGPLRSRSRSCTPPSPSSSHMPSSSSLPTASPPRFSSPTSSPASRYSHTSSSPPALTPAPALALTRFRVRRAEKRMERLVGKHMSDVESEGDVLPELEEGERESEREHDLREERRAEREREEREMEEREKVQRERGEGEGEDADGEYDREDDFLSRVIGREPDDDAEECEWDPFSDEQEH